MGSSKKQSQKKGRVSINRSISSQTFRLTSASRFSKRRDIDVAGDRIRSGKGPINRTLIDCSKFLN